MAAPDVLEPRFNREIALKRPLRDLTANTTGSLPLSLSLRSSAPTPTRRPLWTRRER
jgi:hypothetical protein